MVNGDIGSILFVDILRMTQYPGAPFTGNIITDLVMFLFIPTVFIIFFIYILLGRIVYGVQWLRILVGTAIFLFMIVNGWYSIFALLAGPYFIFLIIVLGFLYFIPAHFRRGGGGGAPAGPGGLQAEALTRERGREVSGDIEDLKRRLKQVRLNLENAERNLSIARKSPEGGHEAQIWADEVRKLNSEKNLLEQELDIKERLKRRFVG